MQSTKIIHLSKQSVYVNTAEQPYQSNFTSIKELADFSLSGQYQGQKYFYVFDKGTEQSEATSLVCTNLKLEESEFSTKDFVFEQITI